MPDPSAALAVMPYHLRPRLFPGRVRLDDLVWPRGRPARLMGADKTLRDLAPGDHLVAYISGVLNLRPWTGTRARISVLLGEPEALHARHMRLLRLTHRRFHKVFTGNAALLGAIPNGVLFPLGGTWVPDWATRAHDKTRMASLIASNKRALSGHALRHRVADRIRGENLKVDLMGGGYAPFHDKGDGLSPYRFSVVIENVQERNYFTEKLVDAVLCETVPIYWGCPNIGDFIDTSGMVICQNEADLMAALHSLSAPLYEQLRPALLRAKPVMAGYGDINRRLAEALLGPETA